MLITLTQIISHLVTGPLQIVVPTKQVLSSYHPSNGQGIHTLAARCRAMTANCNTFGRHFWPRCHLTNYVQSYRGACSSAITFVPNAPAYTYISSGTPHIRREKSIERGAPLWGDEELWRICKSHSIKKSPPCQRMSRITSLEFS